MQETPIVQIKPDELRKLQENKTEARLLLVDVREEDEYAAAHLPGALHYPLTELLDAPHNLKTREFTVFYCSGGRRSLQAARTVAQVCDSAHKVHHLIGGLMRFDGEVVPDLPNLRTFDTSGTVRDILLRGINLEKGAHRLYESFLAHFGGRPEEDIIRRLVGIEENHARTLYDMAVTLEGPELPPFEELFESLEGDILESGDSFDEVARRALSASVHGGRAMLEICLEMEFKAYDLYRSLAHELADTSAEPILLTLAQQEKVHAKLLTMGLADSLRR